MKAVVFVDVQKDFIDGALKNEKAIEVTPKIVEFAKECVEKGYKIYATRDTHEKTKYAKYQEETEKTDIHYDVRDNAVAGYFATLEGENLPVEHCIEGTDGWMIDERLWNAIEGKVTVVNKSTFGSFDLADIIDEDVQSGRILDNLPIDKRLSEMYEPLDEIILCGFCTDICLLANAIILRAKFPNVKITVMKDLCAGTTEESHENALKAMEGCMVDVNSLA